MQLERILQSQGFGSRKQCRAYIAAGEVRINGAVCDDPRADFAPEGLIIEIRGETWHYAEKVYLAMNKPTDYECTRQPQHHASVYDLLPQPLVNRGVQSVGRLDVDTTGLLLFSDDGQFIHALTSPRAHVMKRYRVTLKHATDQHFTEQLLAGVQLRGETESTAAKEAVLLDAQTLLLTIDQGKYHQVKRMVAAAGNRVETLHRIQIGEFSLEKGSLSALAEGEWSFLDITIG